MDRVEPCETSQSRLKITIIGLMSVFIIGCATPNPDYEEAKQSYYAKDYARAFQELWIPVRQKNPKAIYAMGYLYYYGLGVDKDQNLGRNLIRYAADKDYPPAVIALDMIMKRRYDQYIPFENSPSRPIIPSTNKGGRAWG